MGASDGESEHSNKETSKVIRTNLTWRWKIKMKISPHLDSNTKNPVHTSRQRDKFSYFCSEKSQNNEGHKTFSFREGVVI